MEIYIFRLALELLECFSLALQAQLERLEGLGFNFFLSYICIDILICKTINVVAASELARKEMLIFKKSKMGDKGRGMWHLTSPISFIACSFSPLFRKFSGLNIHFNAIISKSHDRYLSCFLGIQMISSDKWSVLFLNFKVEFTSWNLILHKKTYAFLILSPLYGPTFLLRSANSFSITNYWVLDSWDPSPSLNLNQ